MSAQLDQDSRAAKPTARATGSWRWWIVVAVGLALGLAYELIRYDHSLTTQWAPLVVAAILALALVVALASPGRKRLVRAVVGLALAAGILLAITQFRISSDPLVGDWTATADGMSPTPVAITESVDGYTVRILAPTRLAGSSCELPAGTVVGTLTVAAPGYAGQQLLSPPADCGLSGWEQATASLDETTTLRTQVPSGHDVVYTKTG